MKIISNHNWRYFIYRYEIPETIINNEFDYLDNDEMDGFIYYKGRYYHLSEFEIIHNDSLLNIQMGWNGFKPDSFFSGIVIGLSNDCEQYKIGTLIN